MTLIAKKADGASPIFKTLFFLVIFLCMGIAQIAGAANEANDLQKNNPSSSLTDNTKETSNNSSEIELLKRELEITQKFIDRILATVYWSLGSVVVLTVLLTGFGWYSNTRLHSREIEAIKKEVENLTKSSEFELKEELKNQTNEALSALTEKISPVESSIKETIKRLESRFEKILKEQEKQLKYIEIESEAGFHEITESKSVELGKRLTLLEMAVADNYEIKINRSLKRINTLLAEKCLITHYEARQLSKIINNLPAEYTIMTDTIRVGLKESNPL